MIQPKRGVNSTGYGNMRREKKRQQRNAGDEGSSLNRPERAAFIVALLGTPVTKPKLSV